MKSSQIWISYGKVSNNDVGFKKICPMELFFIWPKELIFISSSFILLCQWLYPLSIPQPRKTSEGRQLRRCSQQHDLVLSVGRGGAPGRERPAGSVCSRQRGAGAGGGSAGAAVQGVHCVYGSSFNGTRVVMWGASVVTRQGPIGAFEDRMLWTSLFLRVRASPVARMATWFPHVIERTCCSFS